jgi:hypothetical protein
MKISQLQVVGGDPALAEDFHHARSLRGKFISVNLRSR